MLPLKVLNRLRLGRSVAAEVPTPLAQYRAWVHVQPLVDGMKMAPHDADYGLEPRLDKTDVAGRELTFRASFVRLHSKYLEYRLDLDLAWEDEQTAREEVLAQNEQELESVLSRWLTDLSALRAPANVEYPWLPRKPGKGPVIDLREIGMMFRPRRGRTLENE